MPDIRDVLYMSVIARIMPNDHGELRHHTNGVYFCHEFQ